MVQTLAHLTRMLLDIVLISESNLSPFLHRVVCERSVRVHVCVLNSLKRVERHLSFVTVSFADC